MPSAFYAGNDQEDALECAKPAQDAGKFNLEQCLLRPLGLENKADLAENWPVNAVKVDEAHRIRISILRPGDYYEPEIRGENEVLLRKVPQPGSRPTYAEALAAIDNSPLQFTKSWDEIKKETR